VKNIAVLEMSMPQVCLNFVEDVVPHLDAAYNLARWLTRNDEDAKDVVQEAYMRAFRFIGGFRGGNVRAWLLRIVRNTCYTWMHQNRPQHPTLEFDEECFGPDPLAPTPEETISRNDDRTLVRRALEELPPRHREVLILRELEGMSYKEISEIMDMPAGTVMSRLSRARDGFRQSLANLGHQGAFAKFSAIRS
jgi:RNA polymerase sigma factor (sigma-70 family)